MTRRFRRIRLNRVRVACALGLAVCGALVVVLGAAATASPVEPAPGEVLKVTHPLFKWTLPAGEGTVTASIATGADTAPSGEFVQLNLVELDALQSDDTQWSPQKPLLAGSYWWHIATRDPTKPGFMFSEAVPFTIAPTIKIESISLQTFGTSRQFIAKVSWLTNVSSVALTDRLFKGKRAVLTHRVTVANGLIDQPGQNLAPLTIPAKIKSHTRLRFVATVKAGPATATAAKYLRVP